MSGQTPHSEQRWAELPRWAERLLGLLIPADNRDVVLGDFAEIYCYIAATEGRIRALNWYVWQVLKSFPSFLTDGFYFGGVMLGNYLIIAIRNLVKRKFFSVLNIGGLAVGVAACLLIFQYVAFEQSYDTFHANREHLYRVTMTGVQEGDVQDTHSYTYYAMGPDYKERVPELKEYVRFHPNYSTATVAYTDTQGKRKALREEGVIFADPSFLTMFSFPLVRGDAETALAEPGSIIITESMAGKYFGNADPIGKTLDVRGWTDGMFVVKGIMQDIPSNSHLQFDFLLPIDAILMDEQGQYHNTDGMSWLNFATYVQLHPGAHLAEVERKFTEIVYEKDRDAFESTNTSVHVGLQPLEDIHLYSDFEAVASIQGSYKTVYFFALVALFVLIIAWVNYINLSTARAVERAKEVGVRKVAGARKGQVISQFLFESVLTNGIALGLAVGLAVLCLPYLNALVGVDIELSIWRNPWFWGSFAGIFGLGVLLSSLYPAFVLSAFQPVTVLKGRLGKAGSKERLRKALVVFQFAASIALLTGTYVVYSQVEYMRGLDLGIEIDQVLVVNRPSIIEDVDAYVEAREAFKAELANHAAIGDIATSTTVPGAGFSWGTKAKKESAALSELEEVRVTWVNENFLETYGLKLAAGRNFSADLSTDLREAILVNETTVWAFGFETNEAALGEKLNVGGGDDHMYSIIGVLKDFNWMSVKREVEPIILGFTPGGSKYSIKVTTENVAETIATVHSVYDEFFPGNPFDYFFTDRVFDEQYEADRRFGTLFGIFALFAILVACLGLVGLAAYTAAQRTKEIGVRKVLGASSWSIVRLLLVDVAKLILVALVLTVPLVYVAADQWLVNFASRIDLTVWLFLVPGLVVMVIAMLTLSYHTSSVALVNPAKSLRYE